MNTRAKNQYLKEQAEQNEHVTFSKGDWIYLEIDMKLISSPRPRFTVVSNGKKNHVKTYMKSNYTRQKRQIAGIYRDTYRRFWFERKRPLTVNICVFIANQKNISKAERQRREAYESVPATKPDVDNYAKTVLDALNGVAYYDDGQIAKQSLTKVYINDSTHEHEKIIVKIRDWKKSDMEF